MQENNNQTLWQIIKSYFNVLPDKDGEKYGSSVKWIDLYNN